VLVYYSGWYTLTLLLTTLNLAGVIVRYRMWRHPPRFLFHLAFVVIAVGAAITHFYGQEGILHIREGTTENRMLSAEPYLQLTIHDGGGARATIRSSRTILPRSGTTTSKTRCVFPGGS